MRRDCDSLFERNREAEFNHYTTFVEAGQHVEEICNIFHGITDHNPWVLQYAADYSRAGLEKRSPRSGRFTYPHFQSAMESSPFFNNDSMVDVTAIPITLVSGSSRSGKRKYLFTEDTRSVRPCTSYWQTRFARSLGSTRVDSIAQVLVPAPSLSVCDWPYYSESIILPLHPNSLCPMQNDFSQRNRERLSTLPFVTWRSRRMLESEILSDSGGPFISSNNSPASQINGLSSAAGFGCQAFPGGCYKYGGFRETVRIPHFESYVGAYTRRCHGNEAETFPTDGRRLNSFDPFRRFMLCRAGRHSLFREYASHSSQSAPLEALETSSRLSSELEVAGNNSTFVSVHGRGTSSIPYNNENGNATPRSASSRRPRQRRRQRGIRQQRLSHELLNQSREDEEVDIDSTHSDRDTDVDEMSYEELLVLEERIGNVETGLSVDSIHKCLKRGKHCALSGASSVTSQKNDVLCSICQEEYRENDELGLLACGHSHHPACIKQWLRLKNQCPICKSAAYSEC